MDAGQGNDFLLYMFKDDIEMLKGWCSGPTNQPGEGALFGLWTNSRNPVVHLVRHGDVLPCNEYHFLRNRKNKDHNFTVTPVDDGDVLHVTVSSAAQEEVSENQVAFTMLEGFPDGDKEINEIIEDTFRKLQESATTQIALLITTDNQVKAYTRKSSTDPPKQTKVLLNPSKDLLYSRSQGLLESGLLEEQKVAIVGLGSGGSHVAIELAKAGVGNFVLVDYDRIELNNIIRHTCGVSDLGRLKTKAIRDRILDKNPFADVKLHNSDINDQENARKILTGCDLIVAATDNIRSRLNINTVSLELDIPVLYGKCAVRAAGGEVVVIRPHKGPCFSCVYKNALIEADKEEVSSFRQAREANPSYVSDNEVEATIQVGLSSDIIPISNMIVKIALVELCKGKDSALCSLENDFRSAYYMWSNRREGQYASYPDDGFDKFNMPSILRWYSMEVKKDDTCKTCNIEMD
ncbi:hypothetical protein QZH41_007709 [Actinostola sp. cb2023]|nr:hypothetical protein QZH41_007709 [Actinostola sp. cb2023]